MDGDSWWYTLWRWATSGRNRSTARSMPARAEVDHSMRPTTLARPTTPGGGDSKSTSDTNVSASAVWVLSGWAMPQNPTS